MELTDVYLDLFFDSILASLVLIPNVELAYIVMDVFGYYNKFYMIIIAVIGNTIGAGLNYLFGYILREIKRHYKHLADSEKLENLDKVANKYLIYLSIFSFLPIWGVIITTVGGFFRVSFKKGIFLVLAGRVVYYCLPILLS